MSRQFLVDGRFIPSSFGATFLQYVRFRSTRFKDKASREQEDQPCGTMDGHIHVKEQAFFRIKGPICGSS